MFKKVINLKVFTNKKINFNMEEMVNLDTFINKKINFNIKNFFTFNFSKDIIIFQSILKEMINFKLFINRDGLISI
ncbi:MAG TPA: hypothetical protein PK351_12765 [Spirochaetota bacterium]|nr:hypothetical protein [Spirochaetota bacterium]